MTVNVRRRQSERKRGTGKKRDKKVKAKDSILSKYPKLLWDVQKKIYGPVLPALVKGAEYLPIVGDLVNPPKLSPKGHDAKVIAEWKKKNKKKKETTKVEKQEKGFLKPRGLA